jgi:imidazolonepropionase-like amidohydrolase
MDPHARFEPKSIDDVKKQVGQLADVNMDILKVFYDDMSHAFNKPLPKLERLMLENIVTEAHAKDLKVMVHAYELENHKDALKAGVDIVAHSVVTAPIDDEYTALAQKNKLLYIGTLSVYHDVFNKDEIRAFIARDVVQRTVPKKTLDTLAPGGPLDGFEETIKREYFKQQLPTIMANMKKAHESGIAIAVGPDTGVPGAFPGIAVHREMELMVKAGVPASAVLVAATKTGAEYLGQPLLGTVEVGQIADLIIINGDPLNDITQTLNLQTVIKSGRVVNREKLLQDIMK